MKKCEYCGNEHYGYYGSGRFCDQKCARGFSTKNKRKEINKKVSKKLKGKNRVNRINFICPICNNVRIVKYNYNYKTCGKKECKYALISKKLKGISKNVGKDNPMYGKSPKFKRPINFFSIKNNCKLICRSTYEKRAFEILENDDNVIKYEYEKLNIKYNNKNNTTIPDLVVYYKNNIKIIEVKPVDLLEIWNNKEKIEAMKNYCKDKKIDFEIWTEKELFAV